MIDGTMSGQHDGAKRAPGLPPRSVEASRREFGQAIEPA
jgi:hypothetical protein